MHLATLQIHEHRPQPDTATPPYHEWSMPDGRAWILGYRSSGRYMLRFPEIADYSIAPDGSRVEAWPAPGADTTTVEHLFMNQVGPLAASRAGLLTLHASAVRVRGSCVAFVGETGRGKSTLAATFATGGAAFLADDGLLVTCEDGCLFGQPGHGSIRLWTDSESALIDPGTVHAEPVSYTSKARLIAGEALVHCADRMPLSRVYLLGPGTARGISITPMRPSLGALELVRHSFLLDISESGQLAHHFEQISRIADAGLVYHLDYPRFYAGLQDVRDAISKHVMEG